MSSTDNIQDTPIPKLTPKERLFVDKYIELNNGAHAVKEAGYKVKDTASASVIANRLLKKVNVATEVKRRRDEIFEQSAASAAEVMAFFARVMRGEVNDQFGLDAPLSERNKAAQELAKRTVDLDAKFAKTQKVDAELKVTLDWKR